MANPSRNRSLGQTMRNLWHWIRRRDPRPPADPYANRLAPLRRGPKGRSGAAVAELPEEINSFFPPRRR